MKKTLCTMLVLLLAALSGLSEGLAPDGALEELLPAEDASSPALELPTDGPAEPEGPCEILPDLDGDAPLDLDGDILLNLDGDVPPGLDGDVPLSLDGDVSLDPGDGLPDPGGVASDFDDILFESGVSNGATPAASGPVLLVAPEEEACFIRGGGDSDALFAAYANGLLRGGGLRANATAYARDRLNDQERTIYDALKPLIGRVADGSRASTEFDVPVSALLGMTRITGAQLTGAPLSNPMTEAERATVEAAWRALFTYDLDSVADALWLDCTYELYWLDRYDVAIRALKPGLLSLYNAALGDQELYVSDDACVTFRFPVLRQYQGDTYILDATTIDRAKRARANAAAIVERYAGCPDWARLAGYVVEICALVRYDDQAATPAWQDANPQRQDPWKLISVFDGDSDTNVVCEGYAQALQYLCELDGGISSRMVTGYAPNSDHAWNLVRMGDGLNYLVDVTRMDGDWDSPGSLADWISENRGRLFLCGGTGSVSGGYEIRDRAGRNAGLRRYRADTLALYPDAALTLAPGRYNPTGFIDLPGGTWYFDADGAYVTGKALLEGFGYRFAADGRLLGTLSGWHTVDGARRFFEADGRLHTRHTPAADAAVPASCAGPGLTEGSHCALCGAVLEKQEKIPATGHTWDAVRYTWADDLSAVTAARACRNDPGHVQSETARALASVATAPTCTARGVTAYTANFKNPAFKAQTRRVRDIPATGHTWGAVRYTWADDLSAVTAARACRNDPGHVQSETARASASVATAPTCTARGVTAYTANFKNPAFKAQARRVRDIPATGHTWGAVRYTWADDLSTVTAARACRNDPGHVQSETARASASVATPPTCTARGVTAYTAIFKNPAFKAQTRRVRDIPATGHRWGAVRYTWADDLSAVTAARACLNNPAHIQAETALASASVATPPTCTARGVTAYTARFKNPAFKSQAKRVRDIPATGHTPVVDPAVPPTAASEGLTEGSHCAVCGRVLTAQRRIPRLDTVLRLGGDACRRVRLGRTLQIVATNGIIRCCSSSDTAVATVSGRGRIVTRRPGTATITVRLAGGKKLRLKLTVKAPSTPGPRTPGGSSANPAYPSAQSH